MKRFLFPLLTLAIATPSQAEISPTAPAEWLNGLGLFTDAYIEYDQARNAGLDAETAFQRAAVSLSAGGASASLGAAVGGLVVGGMAKYFLQDSPLEGVATMAGAVVGGEAGYQTGKAVTHYIYDNIDLRNRLIVLLEQRYAAKQPYLDALAEWMNECANNLDPDRLECDPVYGEASSIREKMTAMNHTFCLAGAAATAQYFPEEGLRFQESCHS